MPKNFLKVPPEILSRLATFALDDVVAACAKQIKPVDIANYAHLGMKLENDKLVLPAPFVPEINAGKFSRMNVVGKVVKRKDLPKIIKTFSFYAPNWGDSSNGEHLVSHDREVYRIDFIPPKEVELSISLLDMRGNDFLIKFAIDEVINRNVADFEAELLYNLNILQENVGAADVFEAEATLADYQASVKLDWEILPVGRMGPLELAQELVKRANIHDPQKAAIIAARLATFTKLKPKSFIVGTSGFARYFGAMYGDDFVVFENIRYGNALYVMFEDWHELSKKSRLELIKGDMEGFERIEHKDGWERRLEAMLEHYRDH